MKKKIKAFTLVELIVVMAIMGILMAALMNFYKPIRETYVDSTMIENMRSTQDGILEYLTENVRYADRMLIFDSGANYSTEYEFTVETTDMEGNPVEEIKKIPVSKNINSPKDAYEAFCVQFGFIKQRGSSAPASYVIDDTKYEKTLKNIHIIVINRSNGYVNGIKASSRSAGYNGRIITNIIANDRITANLFTDPAGARTASSTATGDSYMALGGAYYGNYDYGIFIDKDKTWDSSGKYSGSLTFTIQNSLANTGAVIKNGKTYGSSEVNVDTSGNITLTTSKAARTKNLEKSGVDYFTSGSLKVTEAGAKLPAGTVSPTGNGVTSGDVNTYIVYLEPEESR